LVKLFVRANADSRTIEEIWKETIETSPVGNTLAKNVKIIPEVKVID